MSGSGLGAASGQTTLRLPPSGLADVSAPRRGLLQRRIDRFDLGVLAVLAGVSIWLLGLDVWQVVAHGRIWTGTDGVLPQDQMQYLAWIQGTVSHGAAPNMFVLRHTPADFLQPIVAISAGLVALGLAPWLALLLWKPVAVGGVFFATRAYVHRTVAGQWPRRAALILALFFAWIGFITDSWLGFWSWGYPFGLIALAAALTALLAYERDRAANRVGWLPPLLGALASWLHPWQGETLILILIGSEAVMRRRGQRVPTCALMFTIIASVLPLAYYAFLVHTDFAWKRLQELSVGSFPLSKVALAFAPLALAALLVCRTRPPSFIAAATRVWPIAALAVFLFSESAGSAPTHALLGITIPLAVLAVEGMCSVRWPSVLTRHAVLPALAVVALTVPASIHELSIARRSVAPRPANPNFIARGEREALRFLERNPLPGGVLTSSYLGTVVPAETGRQTFVGNCYWSQPHCGRRTTITDELFDGMLRPRAARTFVATSGARFVLSDCQSHGDLKATLALITRSVHRFGCASVYVID
jgi:hypothetical protein